MGHSRPLPLPLSLPPSPPPRSPENAFHIVTGFIYSFIVQCLKSFMMIENCKRRMEEDVWRKGLFNPCKKEIRLAQVFIEFQFPLLEY